MIRSEFDRTAFDRASFSAHDGVKILAVVGDGSEDFISGSGFDRGGPLHVCVDRRVVSLCRIGTRGRKVHAVKVSKV